METNYKLLIAFAFSFIVQVAFAQFNTPSINGNISVGEYGLHADGQNQQTNSGRITYLTWDATNLYVATTGSNPSEALVIYLDKDPQIPVNGGSNANGTNIGFNYDNTNFAELPFRADLVVYAKDTYREYRTANLINNWGAPSTSFGDFEFSGLVREVSIPWSIIGGMPASFNFFTYVTTSGGNVFSQTPIVNASGNIGTSARYERYYTVTSTANGSATKPFSRESYVFNSTTDNNAFGAINVYDFTMNSSGRQIARTGVTNWNITGNLVVGNGTVFFGSGGSYGTTSVSDVNVVGGTLNMDATTNPLNVSGNVSISAGATLALSNNFGGDLNIGGNFSNSGTFNHNNRAVTFNGSASQTIAGSSTFSFAVINNSSGGVTLAAPVTISNNLTLTNGKLILGSNNLTLGNSTVTGGSASSYIVTNSTGKLRRTVTSSSVLFPVGITAYNPLALTNTGTSDVIGVSVQDGAYATAYNNSKAVNRSWSVTEAVAGGSTLSIVAQYNTADGAGTNFAAGTTPRIGVYNGSTWVQANATSAGSNPFTYTSSSTIAGPTAANYFIGIGKDDAFIQSTYISQANGNWSLPATWVGGIVPPAGVDIIINHNVTLNQNATISSITINPGATFTASDASSRILTISNSTNGTTLVNNGTWANGSGGSTVDFTGTATHTISGSIAFNNVSASTGLNFGTATIINGSFTINAGGFVSINPPTYASGSTLLYNTNNTYIASAEWTPNAVSGPGVPDRVQVTGTSTTCSFGASSQFRQLNGLLTIQSGCLLNLSSSFGGDLQIGGTFTINGGGSFNANGRLVTFNGTTNQIINSGSSVTFNFLSITNTSSSVTTNTNVVVSNSLNIAAGGLLWNGTGRTLNLSASTNSITGTLKNSGTIIGTTILNTAFNSSSIYEHNQDGGAIPLANWNTGSFCLVTGAVTNPPSSLGQSFRNFSWNNSGQTSTISLAGLITVNGNFILVNDGVGSITMGATANALTVSGNFQLNSSTSFTLSSTAGGNLNVGGNFTNNGTFVNNTRIVTLNGSAAQAITGATTFGTLGINNSSTGVTIASAVTVTNDLTLTNGKLILGNNNLSLGTATITGGSASSYIVTNSAGQVQRTVTSSSVLFPVGITAYNPLTLTNTGTSDVIGVSVQDVANAASYNTAKAVNRSWSVTEAVAGGSILSIVAQYNTADGAGANFAAGTTPRIGVYNGATWVQANATSAGSNPFTYTSSSTIAGPASANYFIGIGKDDAFIQSTYISQASGNWSLPATWLGGIVPPAGVDIIINNNVVLNQDATISSITVNAGRTFTLGDATVRTLTIDNATSGITLVNNGTWATGTAASKLVFSGAATHTISGTSSIGNVFLSTGVNFGANTTVTGLMEINSGGFVSVNPPIYSTTSTLSYNTGGSYNRGAEWNSAITAVPGYPQNDVFVKSGTLNLGGSDPANSHTCAKDFYIFPGAAVTMDQAGSIMTNFLKVGRLRIEGNLTLSSAFGGDLQVTGHFWQYSTGTFTPNGRAVTFTGTQATQQIQKFGSGSITFDYLIIDKTTGTVQLYNTTPDATNIVVNNDLTFSGTNTNQLDLNGQALTMNGTSNINISGNVTKNINSSIVGATFAIDGGVKTVVATGSTLLNFATNVTIVTTGGINFGASVSNINGIFRIGTNGYVNINPPTYSTTSTLDYQPGGAYVANAEWATNATSGVGVPFNVNIANNTSLTFGTSNLYRAIQGNLSFAAAGNTLTLSSTSGGDLKIAGNVTYTGIGINHIVSNSRTLFFFGTNLQTFTWPTVTELDYIVVDKTAGNITCTSSGGNSLQLKGTGTDSDILALTNGNITMGVGTALNFINTSAKNINIGVSGTRSLSSLNAAGTGSITITTSGSTQINLTNVTTTTPIDFGNGLSTIVNNLTINSGGTAFENAPAYGASSTLIYNTGSFIRGVEWSATSGYGYPNEVTIASGVTLNFGANVGENAAIAKTLNIQSGAFVDMNSPENMTANTQIGSLILDGTLNLSSSLGGSFTVNNGNVTMNGTLNQNGNNFIIQGNTNGIISGTNAKFSKLIYNRTGVAAVHPVDVSVCEMSIGAGSNFAVQNDLKLIVDVNLYTGLPPSFGNIIKNGSLSFLGTGYLEFKNGNVTFDGSTPTAFKKVSLDNATAVFTNNAYTISDTLVLKNASSFDNSSIAPTYGASSYLIYSGNGLISRGTEWSALSGAGCPQNVIVRTNSQLQFASFDVNDNTPIKVTNNFTIEGGSTVDLNTAGNQFLSTLQIDGNLTLGNTGNGTLVMSNSGAQELKLGGNYTISAGSTFTPVLSKITLIGAAEQNITILGSGNFYSLKLAAAGGAKLFSNINVANDLEFSNSSNGHLDLNNFNLNLSSSASIVNEDNDSRIINTAGTNVYGQGFIGYTKNVASPTLIDDSNLGIELNSINGNIGNVTVRRYAQPIAGVGSAASIKRVYEVIPSGVVTGNVLIDYLNVPGELNGNTAIQGQFQLFNTTTSANFNEGSNYNYITPSNIGTLQLSSPTNVDLIFGPNFFTAASINSVPLAGIINIPADVSTLEEAVNDINANGVGAGGVTVNIAPGYIGSLGNIIIDVQNNPPSAANPLIFQGDPNNLPTFNARPGGTIDRDGVVRILGTSFVTVQNIIFVDPPINDDNFERMEWGIAILKKTNNDASQNVTIRNCRILLQNADTASTGIYIGNHSLDPTHSFTPTLSSGNFDQIRIWGNTITKVNKGVILRGFSSASSNLFEKNIFVGDSAVIQNGNILNNLGGNTTPTIGVQLNNVASFVIGNNSIDNTANGGQNSQGDIRGISVIGNSSGNSVIASNTLSLKQGLTNKPMMVINNGLNSTSAFLRIKKNVIQNSLVTAGSSGEFFAIRNAQPEIYKLQIDSNRIINNVNINTSANVYGIYNTSETERVYILRDTVRNFSSSTPADMFVIYNPSGADSVVVFENTIINITKTGSGGTLAVYYNDAVAGFVALASQSNNGGVQIQAGAGVERIVKNYIKNVTGFGVANLRGILTTGRTNFDKIVNQNKVKTFTAIGGTIKGITIADGNDISANTNTLDNYTSSNSIFAIEAINGVDVTIDNDSIFNITQTGAGNAYGILHTTTSSGGHAKNIKNNDIFDISKTTSTGEVYAIAHEESGNGSTSMTTNDNFIDNISNNGAGAAYGILHTGSGSGGPHNINNTSNDIDNVTSSGAGSAFGILHTGSGSGGPHNFNFTTNNIANISNSGSGSAYGILHTGSGSGGPNNFSDVGNTINTVSNTAGGEAYGIFNESSGSTPGLNQERTITGNGISNIINNGGGAAYGILHTGSGSGGPHVVNCSTNTIESVSSNGTGSAFGILHTGSGSGGPNNFTNSSNTINNISNSSSGNAYGILHTGSGSGGPNNYSRVSNTISNVTNSGSGNAFGILHTGSGSGGPNIGITRNNTISNLSTSTGSGACYGILHTGSGSGGPNKARISGNTLSNFSSASDSIEGIRIVTVDSLNLEKNRIVKFATVSGRVEGINITSTQAGLLGVVSNSIIGDFTTVSSNTNDAFAGINVNGSAATSIKFYYNSVYLQASSSGASFGSSAFAFNSSVPVDLRNNIFINKSNPTSGGGVRVLARNGVSGGLLNSSNNNAYFVSDSTISNNFIFSDGTNNYQSFNAYRNFVGFESSSFAENVNFLSVDGSNANFLKVNTSTETRIESGGTVSNLGISNDADGALRFGAVGYAGIGTATDVGAFENNYTPILYQWLGLVSNNWNTAGNWTGGVLPNSSRDIVIRAITSPQPNLSSVDANCRKIKFIPNGAINPSVTIAAGRKLIVGGDLEGNGNFVGTGIVELNSVVPQSISGIVSAVNVDVNNSNGVAIVPLGKLSVSRELGLKNGVLTTNSNNLVITSSGSTAGFINDFSGGYSGSIAGGASIQRFINQPIPYSHTITSPVTNGNTVYQNYNDNFVVNGSPAGYVYNTNPNVTQPIQFPSTWWFDETLTAPETPGYVNGIAKVMSPGLGIMATIPQNRMIDVVGTANTGNYSIPVTRTDDGLNLIGNPYPSPISLNAMISANSSTILPFVYIWNKTNYAVYSSGPGIWVNNIGAGANDRLAHSQGFFVISNVPGSSNVLMNNSMRTTNQSYVYFATPQNECRIQLKDGAECDELLIRTDGESNDEYDLQTDAKKLLNGPISSSTIYSLSKDNYSLAINTFKDFEQDKIVPVSINSKTSGNKELEFTELSSIDPSVNVYLEDASLGKFQNMRANSKYQVYLTEGNSGNRFFVHFSKKALISPTNAETQGMIYSSQSNLFLDLTKSTGNTEIRIYNSLGQLVEYKNMSSSNGSKAQLNLENLSGAYVVQLTTNGEVKNEKVVFGN
jgi:CRISPR/Cas system CMR-associated protein Cmr5 small subunit